MVKVRVIGQAEPVEFSDRDQAFEWVRKTRKPKTMFSLLTYDVGGVLESMDRFTFTGSRFLLENIVGEQRQNNEQ